MAIAVAPRPEPTVRRGPSRWADGYVAMSRWELTSLRLWLPTVMLIQVMAGAGFVLGISLFFRDIPPSAALFVSTGVPVILMVMLGLMMGPQLVADQRIQGTYEFLRALPAPRTAAALAWYSVTLVASLPAIAIALWVAHMRYGIAYQISPAIVPAVLLTTFTGTMMGYALGHAMPSPMATRLVTQLLVFVVFGFAPINFPVTQMPSWLAAVNWWLPFRHMGVIVRAALVPSLGVGVSVSYVIVAVWGIVCAAASAWALGRRR
jgi:ABC-2 type transport system permease protein